jgi:hypothetical protein
MFHFNREAPVRKPTIRQAEAPVRKRRSVKASSGRQGNDDDTEESNQATKVAAVKEPVNLPDLVAEQKKESGDVLSWLTVIEEAVDKIR